VTVDPRAVTGFGSSAGDYERGRPSYPPGAVARVARDLGVTMDSSVLDLAAGTGKLSRVLAPLVARVIAVEPSEVMLAELRAQLPDVDARQGSAEDIPLADDMVAAVFVGEAFHWFQTADACREIARVLRPRGGLAVLYQRSRWSTQQLPWLPAFDELVAPYRQSGQGYPAGQLDWKTALDERGLFEPVTHVEAGYDHDITAEDFVALVASWSWIANLPNEPRATVLRAVSVS
jgi:SAM-dependent methyltransferase